MPTTNVMKPSVRRVRVPTLSNTLEKSITIAYFPGPSFNILIDIADAIKVKPTIVKTVDIIKNLNPRPKAFPHFTSNTVNQLCHAIFIKPLISKQVFTQ